MNPDLDDHYLTFANTMVETIYRLRGDVRTVRLRPRSGPENATVREVIEVGGTRLIFLPPDDPNPNPIKKPHALQARAPANRRAHGDRNQFGLTTMPLIGFFKI